MEVELNALWFNALSILADLEARLGDPAEAKPLRNGPGGRRRASRRSFWNEGLPDDVQEGREDRPGLALSLPFPLLPKPKAARMLAAVGQEIDTPAFGLLLGPYLHGAGAGPRRRRPQEGSGG